jgi:hypothetical protein
VLERAYRETTYVVFVPGGGTIELHPGQRSRALDRLLAGAGVRSWALITAWNPGSRPVPSWRNRYRQDRMFRLLWAWGCIVLPGAGIPAGNDWAPEESVLACGLPPGIARRVARAFGQNAIVEGRRGRRAELTWVR